jgi:hypothetical protein
MRLRLVIPWPHTLLAKVKRQRRALALFLKSGWAALSGNRRAKRGPVRRASRAVVWVASRGRGDPDGSEGLQRGQRRNVSVRTTLLETLDLHHLVTA